MVFCSCSKDESNVNPTLTASNENKGVKLNEKNQYLIINKDFYQQSFESTEELQKLKTQIHTNRRFISFNTYKSTSPNSFYTSSARLASVDTSNYTEFLEQILNPDGIVRIGDYIIKINVGKNKAYAIFAKDSVYYNSLLAEDETVEKVYVFSLEMEVLKKMDSISLGQNVSSAKTEFWGLFCREPWAIQRSAEHYRKDFYNCKAQYRARAIYFDYLIWGVMGYNFAPSKPYLNLNVNGNGRKRCIGHNVGLNQYLKLEMYGNADGTNRVYEKYAYQGADALSNYNTTFRVDGTAVYKFWLGGRERIMNEAINVSANHNGN